MLRFLLPLLLLTAQSLQAQFDADMLASAESIHFATCKAPESDRKATSEAKHTSGQMRLINRPRSIEAFISGSSQKAGAVYRIMRSVNPDLGWEFIAEGTTGLDPISVVDDNPLPGRVVYKLEATDSRGKYRTLDIRVVNRPLGIDLAEVDFLTSPNGFLLISENDLPENVSTVEIFDLQGGTLKAGHTAFGQNIKIATDHLPFGVYQAVITGNTAAVKMYFLAHAQY